MLVCGRSHMAAGLRTANLITTHGVWYLQQQFNEIHNDINCSSGS